MDALWTLPELVAEVAIRIAALPAPKNGQVRAVPDDRTVRYYGTIGLLDRPAVMRGRTALYGKKHAAQVVAIKRLQTMGRSLAEIQALWPTLDDATLARMSGVAFEPGLAAGAPSVPAVRDAFWKREPAGAGAMAGAVPATPVVAPVVAPSSAPSPAPSADSTSPAPAIELRIELAPNVVLSLSVTDESVAISPADVRAIRAAAASLVAELASRHLTPHPGGDQS